MTSARLDRDRARAAIRDLVARFENLTPARRRAYNETATRNDFIDPLFAALGWNMHDNAEVAREDTVNRRKRVDYAFKTRGVTRFLLEAKRPTASLDDSDSIRQATDYAWNQGVDWAVLCNFDEIRVFYASHFGRGERHRPVLVLHHSEYESRFDDLWLLSRTPTDTRELAKQMRGLPRRQPVDEQLFEDLAEWRRDLLGAAQAYNENWTQEQCEEAVQRILNRLIFIRSVEDRGIEDPHLVSLAHELVDNPRTSAALPKRLVDLFRQLDDVYNARLFARHFSEDYVGEAQPLVDMVKGLDHRIDGTTYNFSAIGVDVLGTIYEQYLTKVQAERERRKLQGIYYTPRYIVSYIVRNTLTRALEAAMERGGLEAARQLRVLDPACGSGSFLIAAFDVLDDWFAQNDHSLSETTKRRRHILGANLFGVDLDTQAVEVTRLNLWLRAVDKQELLPEIPNVREGNSLVDESFDWQREFPPVFGGGGFDVVIGNPPYVRQEALSQEFKAIAEATYCSFKPRADLYFYFYERALNLLCEGGLLGFISSNKFFRSLNAKRLRNFLAENSKFQDIVDLAGVKVFRGVAVDSAIVVTQRQKTPSDTYEFYFSATDELRSDDFDQNVLDFDIAVSEGLAAQDSRSLSQNIWSFSTDAEAKIHDQMRVTSIELQEYLGDQVVMVRGIVTGMNGAFIIPKGLRNSIVRTNPQSAPLLRPLLAGKDLRRYFVEFNDEFLIGIHTGWTREQCGDEDPEIWMRKHHPQIMNHLSKFIPQIFSRKNQGKQWWETYPPQSRFTDFEQPKLIYPEISPEGRFTLDTAGFYPRDTVHIISVSDVYLLGILNSKPLLHYFKQNAAALGSTNRKAGLRWKKPYVSRIPIVPADPNEPRRQTIELCVREALDLAPRHAAAMKGSHEQEELGRRLDALNAEIDAAVCSLYGLTDAQKARVMGSS
ncbi:MAG: N-6 DNA methylase [Anaerolineaceae bacterium]|nr:N-6 DNA methylase [Anaerolineaceae bacterium]MDE0327929.1 N-6 DNA methylase [Anaerolineaceae bacterium]